MGFDQRSLKRLEELGQRLPGTGAAPQPAPRSNANDGDRRRTLHAVETETDPEKLFQQLMQASPDGHVPPHLLERLKDLEDQRRRQPDQRQPGRRLNEASKGPGGRPRAEPDALYVAFEQLLLEDDAQAEQP